MGCWDTLCTWLGLGCCIDEEKFRKTELAEVVQNKDRNCTDVPCLLFLIAVFISQIVLISYASNNGANPELLFHGYDYNGTICDSSNNDGSYVAWPDLTTSYKVRICVESCKETRNASSSKMIHLYESEEFLKAYCIPTVDALENATHYDFNSDSEQLNRAISDINTAKWLILISSIMAIIIAFMYLHAISCLGRFLIWLSIIVTFIGGFMLSYYLIKVGIEDTKDEETSSTGKAEIWIGAIIIVILICLFLALFWMRKRIELAFRMLEEASRVIRDLKTTLLFPIFYSFVGIAYVAFWITVTLYIYSVKTKKEYEIPESFHDNDYWKDQEYYTMYKFDPNMRRALVYNFILLIYIMQVIIYYGFMVLSGAIADWYFSHWDFSHKHKVRGYGKAELSYSPILESLWRVTRFHIGSLAFGALLITPIRIMRGILSYIQIKTKDSANPAAKCLLCCAQCCLKCLQCVLDKITKEGFVFTTIYGSAFCYSSLQALKLLWENIGRATIIEGISKYMEIFGRIAISSLTTGLCLAILYSYDYYTSRISSFIFPVIIIFMLSYLIAALFMMIFEVAVDTIFLCFLTDEKVHGSAKFAHPDLSSITTLNKENENQQEHINPI